MRRDVTGVSGKTPSKLRVNERLLLPGSDAWLTHYRRGQWEVQIHGSDVSFWSSYDWSEGAPWNRKRHRVYKAWRKDEVRVFRSFKEALAEALESAIAKNAAERLRGDSP